MEMTPPQMNGAPPTTDSQAQVQAPANSNGVGNGSESHHSHPPPASAGEGGEKCLSEMNTSFAKCLSLVCPPIQYPPHCRFNPVQQDAADMSEIEARLEEFFVHAKQLELLFLREANEPHLSPGGGATPPLMAVEHRHDLEMEILNLENELNEKNDLIEKYHDVIRGWEGKFKRLGSRLAPDRE